MTATNNSDTIASNPSSPSSLCCAWFDGTIAEAQQAAAARYRHTLLVCVHDQGDTTIPTMLVEANIHRGGDCTLFCVVKGTQEFDQLDSVSQVHDVPRVHCFPPPSRNLPPMTLAGENLTAKKLAQSALIGNEFTKDEIDAAGAWLRSDASVVNNEISLAQKHHVAKKKPQQPTPQKATTTTPALTHNDDGATASPTEKQKGAKSEKTESDTQKEEPAAPKEKEKETASSVTVCFTLPFQQGVMRLSEAPHATLDSVWQRIAERAKITSDSASMTLFDKQTKKRLTRGDAASVTFADLRDKDVMVLAPTAVRQLPSSSPNSSPVGSRNHSTEDYSSESVEKKDDVVESDKKRERENVETSPKTATAEPSSASSPPNTGSGSSSSSTSVVVLRLLFPDGEAENVTHAPSDALQSIANVAKDRLGNASFDLILPGRPVRRFSPAQWGSTLAELEIANRSTLRVVQAPGAAATSSSDNRGAQSEAGAGIVGKLVGATSSVLGGVFRFATGGGGGGGEQQQQQQASSSSSSSGAAAGGGGRFATMAALRASQEEEREKQKKQGGKNTYYDGNSTEFQGK